MAMPFGKSLASFVKRPKVETFSDVLNWESLPEPGVLACKDGSFVAAWAFSGFDTESIEQEEIDVLLGRLARGLGKFEERDCFWIEMVRRPFAGLTEPQDPLPYTALDAIDLENRARLSAQGAVYENQLYLAYQRSPAWEPGSQPVEIATELKQFARACRDAEAALGRVLDLHRLGRVSETDLDGRDVCYDELIGLLMGMLTGRARRHRVPREMEYVYLDKLLGVEFRQPGQDDIARVDDRPVAFLTIDGFPTEPPRGALEVLEMLGLEFRWTARLVPHSQRAARKILSTSRQDFRQQAMDLKAQVIDGGGGDRDAHSDEMALNASEMIADVSRGETFAAYQSVLQVFGPPGSPNEVLDTAIGQLTAVMEDAGFSLREEREGALEMYLSALPGHAHRALRDVFVKMRHAVNLIPVRTSWKGEPQNPSKLFPLGSPSLVHALSLTGELFHFNLHVDDLGHTLIFGPSSAGKSVLLGLLAINFLKYTDARVIFFDKGASSRHLANALGGSFTAFGGEEGRGVAPISHLRELGLDWGVQWVSEMARLNHVQLRPDHYEEIRAGLQNGLDTDRLTLKDLQHFVQNPELKGAIRRFSSENGPSLLDDTADPLRFSHFTVFETEDLFRQDKAVITLALDYVFAEIARRFDGKPTLLIFDEAHSFVRHPQFEPQIFDRVKEGRRSNVSVLLATQNISDLHRSGMVDVLTTNCPTKVFLPNHQARNDAERKYYEALGLNAAQIDLISTLIPKRDYYLVKPGGQRVVDFFLGPIALSVLGQTNKLDAKRAARRYAEDPEYWIADIEAVIAEAQGVQP